MSSRKLYVFIVGMCSIILICGCLLPGTSPQAKLPSNEGEQLMARDIPAPIISNVQQAPPREDVGYDAPVNVSCAITTAASLNAIQVNWTNDDWGTDAQVDMTGPGGNGSYWGLIPGAALGETVKYHVFVQDTWGNQTVSAEYNYTTIDNVPPNIIHQNTSAWVKPLAPWYTFDLRVECEAEDVKVAVSSVKIWVTQPGMYTNVSWTMNFNASSQRWYNSFNIIIDSGNLYYYINATDANNNYNCTQIYAITIDSTPPQVLGWEDPASPDYTQAPYLYANLTDQNAITVTEVAWSLDWITNHSMPVSNIGGDTWRTDAPLPVHPWNTTVHWKVSVTDGKHPITQYFSYCVADRTPPNVIQYINRSRVLTDEPTFVWVAIGEEPANASGIKLRCLYYGLKSEGYAMHRVDLVYYPGIGAWYGEIPEHPGETVRWYIYIEDYAGNYYASSTEEYSVEGGFLVALILALGIGIPLVLIVAIFLRRRRHR